MFLSLVAATSGSEAGGGWAIGVAGIIAALGVAIAKIRQSKKSVPRPEAEMKAIGTEYRDLLSEAREMRSEYKKDMTWMRTHIRELEQANEVLSKEHTSCEIAHEATKTELRQTKKALAELGSTVKRLEGFHPPDAQGPYSSAS